MESTHSTRQYLTQLAEEARERRLTEEGGDEYHLKGKCHVNALTLSNILTEHGIDHTVIAGVLIGDNMGFPAAENFYPRGDVADEHGESRTPVVCDNIGRVKNVIQRDEVRESGVAHVWIEVQGNEVAGDENDETWIVEPYAEMRGTHEYTAVATSVMPLDYVYVENHTFTREQLLTVVNNTTDAVNVTEAIF